MADEGFDGSSAPPIRLMNFVSEQLVLSLPIFFFRKLEEARRSRGSRVDDGTAQRDRSLYEAAVAAQAQSTAVSEPKEISPVLKVQEEKLLKRKNSSQISGIFIKVKPQVEKARGDPTSSPEETVRDSETHDGDKVKTKVAENYVVRTVSDQPHTVKLGSLVSYSDGSDEDDE